MITFWDEHAAAASDAAEKHGGSVGPFATPTTHGPPREDVGGRFDDGVDEEGQRVEHAQIGRIVRQAVVGHRIGQPQEGQNEEFAFHVGVAHHVQHGALGRSPRGGHVGCHVGAHVAIGFGRSVDPVVRPVAPAFRQLHCFCFRLLLTLRYVRLG